VYVSATAVSVVVGLHVWFQTDLAASTQPTAITRTLSVSRPPPGRRPDDGVWYNFSAPPALLLFAYSAWMDERTAPAAAAGASVIRVMAVSTKTEELRERGVSLYCVMHGYPDNRPPTVTRMIAEPTAIGAGCTALPCHSSSQSVS